MKLERLQLDGWRQFHKVDLEFDPRLTVIIGKNGSGKSTILNVLAAELGWGSSFIKTTEGNPENKNLSYPSGIHNESLDPKLAHNQIGFLSYCGKPAVPINLSHRDSEPLTGIQVKRPRQLEGVHIPADQSPSHYSRINSIPTKAPTRKESLGQYYNAVQTRSSPFHCLKRDFVALSIFAPGNSLVAADLEASTTLVQFTDILEKLLPPDLNFQRIEVRQGDIVFILSSGAVNLEALSAGLLCLIHFAWQILMASGTDEEIVVTIDEPEAHLHRSMQRILFPRLLDAFPNAQFIIGTHSPLIANSVPNSRSYALYFGADGYVRSESLPSDVNSVTDPQLREILDL